MLEIALDFKNIKIMKSFITFIAICLMGFSSYGQLKQTPQIDSIFNNWIKPNEPGCAIGVVKDGHLIYKKGYGIADLEHDIEWSSITKSYIASLSKQFTAFCVLLLEEEGKLSLDDTVQTYLPDFPDYETPITISHLVHHTSGLRDQLFLLYLQGKDHLNGISQEEVYELLKKQKSLNHIPGKKFQYTNGGYFLLAKIIEKISGKSLRTFAQERVFEPLGMKNTFYYDDNTKLIINRADAYERDGDDFKNMKMRIKLVGAGGIYSTVEDLALWSQNFNKNILGNGGQDIIVKMQKEGLLNNGGSCGYAFGLRKEVYNNLNVVLHGGSLGGYRSGMVRFPDENLTIIVLANRNDAKAIGLAYQVADLFLEEYDDVKVEVNDQTIDKVEKFNINQLVGSYEIRPGYLVEISLDDNNLKLLQVWDKTTYTIVNVEGNTYQMPNDASIKFNFSDIKNEYTQQLTAIQKGKTTVAYRKPDVNLQLDLESYVGDYYSDELNITYPIYIEDNVLKTKIGYLEVLELHPKQTDVFLTKNGATLKFTRIDGNIVGMEIDARRVNNLELKKLRF